MLPRPASNDFKFAVIGMLFRIKGRMILARLELQVVPSEVPLELKVVVNKLLKDVLFHK
jgi:hypothetical protein